MRPLTFNRAVYGHREGFIIAPGRAEWNFYRIAHIHRLREPHALQRRGVFVFMGGIYLSEM